MELSNTVHRVAVVAGVGAIKMAAEHAVNSASFVGWHCRPYRVPSGDVGFGSHSALLDVLVQIRLEPSGEVDHRGRKVDV